MCGSIQLRRAVQCVVYLHVMDRASCTGDVINSLIDSLPATIDYLIVTPYDLLRGVVERGLNIVNDSEQAD